MKCNLCPRNCNVDRTKGELGYCKAPHNLVIARYSLHEWEEPIISGTNGSGTIFFSYCNLRCCFCQNYQISEQHIGKNVTIKEFSDICIALQEKGATNINLVSPTPYVDLIIKGLKLAKKKGLKIPIVYNTSGYENVETIKSLKGLIDIYLPDFKYYDDTLALKYSKCPNYFKYASSSIEEMVSQVASPQIDESGIMKKGVIVRHLVIPNNIDDSKKIIKYLFNKYQDKIYFSIMNQYTPVRKLKYEELNKTLTNQEYDEVINYAYDLGVRKAFIQEGETGECSFIPDFNIFKGI